jgi:competence protein ComFC
MANFNPRRIKGPWAAGYVLDVHTRSSMLMGYDHLGHEVFDTQRSEIGELLYRLKYQADQAAIAELVDAAESFIRSWKIDFSTIVPVPATRIYRRVQPVRKLAEEIGRRFAVPVKSSAIRKAKQIPELKNVYDAAERERLLQGAFEVDVSEVKGQTILLVDDLYRSGATMNAITEILLKARASKVYAFAFTQTRTRR